MLTRRQKCDDGVKGIVSSWQQGDEDLFERSRWRMLEDGLLASIAACQQALCSYEGH